MKLLLVVNWLRKSVLFENGDLTIVKDLVVVEVEVEIEEGCIAVEEGLVTQGEEGEGEVKRIPMSLSDLHPPSSKMFKTPSLILSKPQQR